MVNAIAGYAVAGTVSSFFRNICGKIFPNRGKKEKERMLFQASINENQQKANQDFQRYLQETGYKNQQELAYMTSMFSRHTTVMSTLMNFQNSLKSRLFDDALRNFPLNIPPLVMLQNSGLSANSLTGEFINDDPILHSLLSSSRIEPDNLFESYKSIMKAHPIALNVFITPLQFDSRISGKEKVSAMVWDNIYEKLESFFISKYNRCGERPVIFYPSAWNANAKPGMHASEIIYFFTKGLPVLVLEPRFDGKQIRFMFSCWGIGNDEENLIRQEITFDFEWPKIVLPSMYKRSQEGLKQLSLLENLPPVLQEVKKRLVHNVEMYECLKNTNSLYSNILVDDISKLFFLSNNDYSELTEMMSDCMGILLSIISDVHHLTSRGIDPLFPEIKDEYFSKTINNIERPSLVELNESIKNIFKSSYASLLLGDSLVEVNLKSIEEKLDDQFKVSKVSSSIEELLQKEAEEFQETEESNLSLNIKNNVGDQVDISSFIKNYCEKNEYFSSKNRNRVSFAMSRKDEKFENKLLRLLKNKGYANIEEWLQEL